MHVHTYQIHNVLNLYHQQLRDRSRSTENIHRPGLASTQNHREMGAGQRQVIMETISAEILDRISRDGPRTAFDEALSRHLGRSATAGSAEQRNQADEFKYTRIDENNRRKTHSLRLQEFSPLIAGTHSSS
jgi:hypothetical protein